MENWVVGDDFWRRRARRITVPETAAMAVAKNTPWELSVGDIEKMIKTYKGKKERVRRWMNENEEEKIINNTEME